MASPAVEQDQLVLIDRLIRQGELPKARGLLSSLQISQLRPAQIAGFASLCRRTDLSELAIRALNPIVRGERALVTPPQEIEVAEYAASLTRIGAAREALELLENVNAKVCPQALLFRAHALFSLWDYRASLEPLGQYLEARLEPYEHLVGMVNLAAAQVSAGQTEPAAVTIEMAILEAREVGAPRLLGNLFELQAQLGIAVGDFEQSRRALAAAQRIFPGGETLDGLLVRKWIAVANYRERSDDEKARSALQALRQEAALWKYWEGVRDCDFHIAVCSANGELLDRLYHGTPAAAFRARLLNSAPNGWSPSPALTQWLLGKPGGPVLDFVHDPVEPEFKRIEQPLPSFLAETLASDAYAPFRTATLFSLLYPGDHFDIDHSPHRVQQLVHRLQKLLQAQGIPIRVEKEPQAYFLRAIEPCGVRTSVSPPRLEMPDEQRLHRLGEIFRDSQFTALQAAEALGVPRRTANRILKGALEAGLLEILGRGSTTAYRFKAT